MPESSKANQFTPFRKCRDCKLVCEQEVETCPRCFCSNFDPLTVEELKATADANGKIRAFSMTIPEWPRKGAWEIVGVEKEG
ncbi:hypothetical protein AMJ48_02060 [Parcubacteria bacterium DG_74_1]|nr:MAG: hypothetical protein AMJ48_02060 [Parcubacteria bacterium DG_74_1]